MKLFSHLHWTVWSSPAAARARWSLLVSGPTPRAPPAHRTRHRPARVRVPRRLPPALTPSTPTPPAAARRGTVRAVTGAGSGTDSGMFDAAQPADRLMTLRTTPVGSAVVVVAVVGELDLHSVPDLVAVIDEVLERPGLALLVLDLSEVAFLGSSGLGVLADLTTRADTAPQPPAEQTRSQPAAERTRPGPALRAVAPVDRYAWSARGRR